MNSLAAYSLILLAALAGGIFSIPLRIRKVYGVDQMWGLAFFLGYFVIPHGMAFILLPGLGGEFSRMDAEVMLRVILFGVGWGVASLCFAHAITRVGVSLGYSIIMGINTAVGSLLPLFKHWNFVKGESTPWIFSGIFLCLASVAICGWAGSRRESASVKSKKSGASFQWGLLLCVISGVMSAGANLGFEFAEPLAKPFLERGIHSVVASLARWLPVYWGATVIVVGWSLVVVIRSGQIQGYFAKNSSSDLFWTLAMAVMLSLTQIPYGMGAYYLGNLGTSLGWAIYMGLSLLVANFMGILRGEWKDSPPKAYSILSAGLFVMFLAMVCLSLGGRGQPAF